MSNETLGSAQAFCRMLPKIELHAHLNGSLNAKTLKDLGCKDKLIREYKLPEHKSSDITLEQCFTLFKIAQNATNTKESVYLATESVIKDFAKENVIYLELRTTPRAEESMSKEEYIESVINAIQNNTTDMIVKLILSIDRRHDPEVSCNSLNTIIQMKDKYPDIIKGLDLSGNPEMGSFDEELFTRARLSGLKTTIHCAEVKYDDEVEKILKFGPDRLGHATCLHPQYGGTQKNWDIYCEKNIPVEFCLSSNVISGTSKNYKEHHIKEWIKNSKPFSINTDDKGVFCTTLSKEYEHALRNHIRDPKALWKLVFNSVDHTFASDAEKAKLKEILLNWFNNIDSTSQFPVWFLKGQE